MTLFDIIEKQRRISDPGLIFLLRDIYTEFAVMIFRITYTKMDV